MLTVPSEIASALSKAQAEMGNASLNKTNPHFKSKFANLASIRDATIPILAKHGLAVTQTMAMEDGQFVLHTTLRHGDGGTIQSTYPLPLDVSKPQAMGSALTYARRYSLASLCGISAEEDDDGNAAEGAISPHPEGMKKETGSHPMDWPKGWNKSKLQAEIKALVSCLEDAVAADELNGILDEYATIIELCEKHLPSWWNERSEKHPEFEPLEDRIQRTRDRVENGPVTSGPDDGQDVDPDGVVESREISPKGPGGWERFDAAIRKEISGCKTIMDLTQLQTDNAENLKAYGEKFESAAQAIMSNFAAKAGELSQGPIE